MKFSMAEEMDETRKLARSLDRVVEEYRKLHRGTRYEELVEKAAARADEALSRMDADVSQPNE